MSTITSKLLEKTLDYSVLKQKVLSKNIANVGTEKYKREDIKFEDVLTNSINGRMKSSNPGHFSGSEMRLPDQPDFSIQADNTETEYSSGKNNVDVDREMAEMAQNQLLFKFAAQKLKGHYITLQGIIKGGGR